MGQALGQVTPRCQPPLSACQLLSAETSYSFVLWPQYTPWHFSFHSCGLVRRASSKDLSWPALPHSCLVWSVSIMLGHRGSLPASRVRIPSSGAGQLPLWHQYVHPLTFLLHWRLQSSRGSDFVSREYILHALKMAFKKISNLAHSFLYPLLSAPSQSPRAALATQGHPLGLRGWQACSDNIGPAWYVAGDAQPRCSAQLPVQSSQQLIIGRSCKMKFKNEQSCCRQFFSCLFPSSTILSLPLNSWPPESWLSLRSPAGKKAFPLAEQSALLLIPILIIATIYQVLAVCPDTTLSALCM